MTEYGYTLTEHDATQPWIIIEQRHETVSLDADVSFFDWANKHYPSHRYTIEPDPWSLSPELS